MLELIDKLRPTSQLPQLAFITWSSICLDASYLCTLHNGRHINAWSSLLNFLWIEFLVTVAVAWIFKKVRSGGSGICFQWSLISSKAHSRRQIHDSCSFETSQMNTKQSKPRARPKRALCFTLCCNADCRMSVAVCERSWNYTRLGQHYQKPLKCGSFFYHVCVTQWVWVVPEWRSTGGKSVPKKKKKLIRSASFHTSLFFLYVHICVWNN